MQPTARDLLFSKFAEFERIVQPVLTEVFADPIEFRFTSADELFDAQLADVARGNRIFVRELLFRVHWAAAVLLQRNIGWLRGVAMAHAANQFLPFCASLRCLVEAAADTSYSMKTVVGTLARNVSVLRDAAAEQARARIVAAEELENALLHAVYAIDPRAAAKAAPGIVLPDSHKALHAGAYLDEHEKSVPGVKELYRRLCLITHPSAFSTGAWSQIGTDTIRLTAVDDARQIQHVVDTSPCLLSIFTTPMNYPLLALRILNVFPVRELQVKALRGWTWDSKMYSEIREIENRLARGLPPVSQ